MFRLVLRFAVLGFVLASAGRGAIVLAPLFQDHAILQREMPVPVWGQADPGEVVTVKFAGQSVRTTAGTDGHWLARLAPLAASTQPAELVVTGKDTVRVADILVGEIWLCSGQSNMEFPVRDPAIAYFRLDNAEAEVAAANHPLIRQFKVARRVAESPVGTVRGDWAVCSPATVGAFTAVGYFFARDMSARLGVPVGIINSTWGGTPIESWMSAEALASDPAFKVVDERWRKMLAEYPAKKAAYEEAAGAWQKSRGRRPRGRRGSAGGLFAGKSSSASAPRPGRLVDARRALQRHDRTARARGLQGRAVVSG